MSDYRRLISYLYSYNNGVKSKNVGFAKTERKGGVVKLWINMKGAFAPEENFRVNFFVRRDNLIAGIDMGECVIHGGVGQFYTARREDSLRVSFDELCGLYIMGDSRGKIFASQWDDRGFSVERIVLLNGLQEENRHQEPENVRSVETAQKEGDAGQNELPVWQRPIKEVYISGAVEAGHNDRVLQERVVQGQVLQMPESQSAKSQKPEPRKTEQQTVELQKTEPWKTEPQTVESQKPEQQISESQRPESQKCEQQKSEIQKSEIHTPKLQEQQLQGQLHASEEAAAAYKVENDNVMLSGTRDRDMFFDGKEPVLAFSEDEIYDCVDIDLAELARLPEEARGLMNNSFVNHGYFNFHHLLLGKKDGNVLVVGVPGVYNRREKLTANMLGFEKFKFSMRPDVKMNHFGYWYREYPMPKY